MGYFNERPDYVAATGLAINQAGHTFVVGDQIYFDGTNWQLAQANSETTLRTAMVSQVPRAGWFVAITDGQVDWPAHGLTPGALYYLSATTPGGYSTVRPVATGQFVQGVFTVVDANTVTVLEMPATTAEGGSGTNATVPVIGGGGSTSLRARYTSQVVNQVAHGFALGDQIAISGASWVYAQADQRATLRIATVAEVTGPDTFVAAFEGVMPWTAHGLTLGAQYYLSDTVPGGITLTPPSSVGSYQQPCIIPTTVDEVRLLEFIISGTVGSSGFREQTVSGLADAANWHRIGSISNAALAELDILAGRPGNAGGSMRIVVGGPSAANPNNSYMHLQLQGFAGRPQIDQFRVVNDNNNLYLEVLTSPTVGGFPIELKALVVGESSSTAFQFWPGFTSGNPGTVILQTEQFNISLAANDIQMLGLWSGIGRTARFGTRNIFFDKPLDMGANKITGLALATAAGDALRWEEQPISINPIGDNIALGTGTHVNLANWTPPASWAGRRFVVDMTICIDGMGTISTRADWWFRNLGGISGGASYSIRGAVLPGANGSAVITLSLSGTLQSPSANMQLQLRMDNNTGNFRNTAGLRSTFIGTLLQ